MFQALVLSLCLVAADPLPVPPVMMIDFGASWCGPCKRFKPIIKRLQARRYPIAYVDIDDPKYADLVKENNVQSVPHFIMVVDGKPVEYLSAQEASEERLQSWIEGWMKKRYGEEQQRLLPPPKPQDEPTKQSNNVLKLPVLEQPKIDMSVMSPYIPKFVDTVKLASWSNFVKASDQQKLDIDFAVSAVILAAAVKAEDPTYKDLGKLTKFAQDSLESAIIQLDPSDPSLVALRVSNESAWIRRYVAKHWGGDWYSKLMGKD